MKLIRVSQDVYDGLTEMKRFLEEEKRDPHANVRVKCGNVVRCLIDEYRRLREENEGLKKKIEDLEGEIEEERDNSEGMKM